MPIIALILLLVVTGCSKNISPDVYTEGETGASMRTLEGTVISIRPVTVQRGDDLQDNIAGGVIGGAAGGLAGATVGKGLGNTAATIGGVVAGAMLGAVIEGAASKQDALEYLVRLKEDGSVRAFVQGPEANIKEGSAVYIVINQQGRTRLIPNPTP